MKKPFMVLAVSALAFAGCSNDGQTASPSGSGTGFDNGGGARTEPATPPSTSAPIEFSNRTLRINVPACSTGDCEVVAQVAGLATSAGPVSIAVVRNTRDGVSTDNVVVLDQIGKQVWAAPTPLPSVAGPVEMVLDGSGNVLIPRGNQVFVVAAVAREVKDFGSFGADSKFAGDVAPVLDDTDGDGYREIKVARNGQATTYKWLGGAYGAA